MASIDQLNYIKSSAAAIYHALTTEVGLAAVWTPKLKVKPEVGFVNTFDFDEGYITKLKVISLQESKMIAWQCIDSDVEWIGTTMTFHLSEKDGVTTVVLEHAGWKSITPFYKWCGYNWAMFLFRLKKHCEQNVKVSHEDAQS